MNSANRLATENKNVSRRKFIGTACAATAAAAIFPSFAKAQAPGLVEAAYRAAPTLKLSSQVVRGNIHVLLGAGGNIAVLPGPEGKLMIDSGIAGTRPQIAAALASIDAQPVKHLINTHWHFDHTGGNEWVHADGATILAHQRTRDRLAVDTRTEGWSFTFTASPAGALPHNTFSDVFNTKLNGRNIALKYYGPCHTDSDISVHFTDDDVLHVGDTCWNGDFPFIDYSTGGSLDGAIRAAQANIAKVTAKTVVIPGHGPVCGKQELQIFLDMLTTVRDRVQALKKQGRTVEEVVAAKPTKEYDAQWGNSFISPIPFTYFVYQGV